MKLDHGTIAGTAIEPMARDTVTFCFADPRSQSKYFFDSLKGSEEPQRVEAVKDAENTRNFVYPVKFFPPTHPKYGGFNYLREIPAAVQKAIAERRAVLIFDTSNEGGRFSAAAMRVLHEQLQSLGLPFEQVIYLTQNTLFGKQYAGWRKREGMQPGVAVEVYHCFLRQMANYVVAEMIPTGEFVRRRLEALQQLTQPGLRRKHFLSLNFTPRPHRVGMMLFLLSRGLDQHGVISFPGLANRKTDLTGRIEALLANEPFPDTEYLLTQLSALMSMTPMVLDVEPYARISPVIDIGNFAHYQETFFSLVTESGVRGSGHRRFTEKPFKPVLGLHPFIVFGLPHTLRAITEYGFRTFRPWLNEDYDDMINDEERVKASLAELERLCNLSFDEFHELSLNLFPSVLHNYNHFGGPLQRHFVQEIETPLLSKILGMCSNQQ